MSVLREFSVKHGRVVGGMEYTRDTLGVVGELLEFFKVKNSGVFMHNLKIEFSTRYVQGVLRKNLAMFGNVWEGRGDAMEYIIILKIFL